MTMEKKAGHYSIEGRLYPSVTTILRVLAKPALTTWLQRQAAEKALLGGYDTVEKVLAAMEFDRDHAGDSGTGAHRIAQSWASGISVDALPGPREYIPAVQAFFRVVKPVVVGTEVTVYNPEHGYAGTLDLLAMIAGKPYVVDYKTSKRVYPEHSLQVEAYRRCTRAADDPKVQDWIGKKGALAERAAIVLLHGGGTWTFNEVAGDWDAFLACKRLWEWQRDNGG